VFDRLRDKETGLFIQQGLIAAGVWQGVKRAGLALAAEAVLDRCEADVEEFSNFAW
jgi:hypothetical protein